MPKFIETHAGPFTRAQLDATIQAVAPGPSRVVWDRVERLASSHSRPPSYTAVVEYWWDVPPRDLDNALAFAWREAGNGANRWLYGVKERVQLDLVSPDVLSRGALKALYLVRRPPTLSNDDAVSGWRRHADTARKHHSGLCRYVQNGVLEAVTPGAPVVHGFAELSFPSTRDFEERMYDGAEGREAIAREASQLVGEVVTLLTRETVVVAGPAA